MRGQGLLCQEFHGTPKTPEVSPLAAVPDSGNDSGIPFPGPLIYLRKDNKIRETGQEMAMIAKQGLVLFLAVVANIVGLLWYQAL